MISPSVISGAILGWGLGANNASNCFATAVSTKAVKYKTAIIITSIFVILGAYIDGSKGVYKLSDYAYNSGINTPINAFLVMLAAAITVTLMTILKQPISTSQAIIGSILGYGILNGNADFSSTYKFFGAWFATPFGAAIIGYILYKINILYIEKNIKNVLLFDRYIKIGYIVAGAFSAYSLGANNVANVTSIYAGKINILNTNQAVIIGGVTIALGVITYGSAVISTVGEGIAPLSPISGLISVISASIVVYIYAQVGIPVSTSQAIVGAVLGIGLVKGINTINVKTLRNILFAWFGTPTIACIISIICFTLI